MQNNQKYRVSLLLLVLFFVLQSAYAQKTNRRLPEEVALAEAQFIEANSLFLLGKYAEAIVKFEVFLKDHPEVAMAHFLLGRTYNATQETEKGLSALLKAIDLDNQNRWFYIELAKVYEANGQADRSAKVMVDLTKIEPTNDFAYKKAAFYYLLAQNPEKAIDILSIGEKKIGFDPEFSYRKYVIYIALGDTQKGIESLQKILKYSPRNTDYRLQLAETYEANKEPKLAEKEYRRILEFDPYHAKALVGLQRRKVSTTGSSNQALSELINNPAIGIDLKIVELVPIIQKANVNSTEQQKSHWLLLVQDLVKMHPIDAKSFSVQGDLYYAIGDLEKALIAYQKTLTKEQSVYPVWQQVLTLQFLKKEYQEVVNTANVALDYFPNKMKIVLFLAEAQYRQGDLKKAIINYQQASLMVGRKPHQKRFVFARLSEVYLSKGDLKNAQKYLDKAVLLDDIQDPHIGHLKKEIQQQKLIPYSGEWLQVFPFGLFLKS